MRIYPKPVAGKAGWIPKVTRRPASASGRDCLTPFHKMGHVVHGVIRGHDQQQNVVAVLFAQGIACSQSGQRNGRGCSPRLRLKNDASVQTFFRKGGIDIRSGDPCCRQ